MPSKKKFKAMINQVTLGDHKKLAEHIPDESISMIFTDPPYPHEHEHVYAEMFHYAARVLKPGGALLTLCGHYQAHRVINAALGYGLSFYWIGWMRQPANTTLMGKRVTCTGKPMLLFSKGLTPKFVWGFWWDSYYQGKREKAFHEWQQSLGWAYHSLKNFTQEDDLILDPFCGGGTVPCAAIALKRNFITFEIDPDTHKRAKERVDNFFAGPLVVEQLEKATPDPYAEEDLKVLDDKWKQMELFDLYQTTSAPSPSFVSPESAFANPVETVAATPPPMALFSETQGEAPSATPQDGPALPIDAAPSPLETLSPTAILSDTSSLI